MALMVLASGNLFLTVLMGCCCELLCCCTYCFAAGVVREPGLAASLLRWALVLLISLKNLHRKKEVRGAGATWAQQDGVRSHWCLVLLTP